MHLILFGAPGVGKGTQAEKISEDYDIPQVSTGEILRSAVSRQTELGKKAQAIMERGELVPDDLMIKIIEDRITQEDCKNGFILDGFPRTIPQAESLEKLLDKLEMPPFKCIEIKVPDDEIIKRLLARGRADDNEETIRKRLKVYKEQTAPVKDYYKSHDHFHSIDGNQHVDRVYKSISHILNCQE